MQHSLKELVTTFPNGSKIVIFAGAGLSIDPNANLPASRGFLECFLKKLILCDFYQQSKFSKEKAAIQLIKTYSSDLYEYFFLNNKQPIPFEVFMQNGFDALLITNKHFISDLLAFVYGNKDSSSNQNHRCIKRGLVNKKNIVAVITTNFDTLIENTDRSGSIQSIYNQLSYNDKYAKQMQNNLPIVFHLHGIAHKRSSLVFLLRQSGNILSGWKYKVIKHFLSNFNCIFYGYSFQDADIVPAIIEALEAKKKEVKTYYYVHNCKDYYINGHASIIDLLEKENLLTLIYNPYSQSDKIKGEYNKISKILNKKLNKLHPTDICLWLTNFYFNYLHNYEKTINLLDVSLKVKRNDRAFMTLVSYLGHKGLFTESDKILKNVIANCRDLFTVAEAFNQLGYNSLFEQADYKSALNYYSESALRIKKLKRQRSIIRDAYYYLEIHNQLMSLVTQLYQSFSLPKLKQINKLIKIKKEFGNLQKVKDIYDPFTYNEIMLYYSELLYILYLYKKLEKSETYFFYNIPEKFKSLIQRYEQFGNPGKTEVQKRLFLFYLTTDNYNEANSVLHVIKEDIDFISYVRFVSLFFLSKYLKQKFAYWSMRKVYVQIKKAIRIFTTSGTKKEINPLFNYVFGN